jgi:hypothetical protein
MEILRREGFAHHYPIDDGAGKRVALVSARQPLGLKNGGYRIKTRNSTYLILKYKTIYLKHYTGLWPARFRRKGIIALFDKFDVLWARKREILRHVAEIAHLYFHRKSELLEMPLDNCVNPFGFSYGKNGWHPVIPLIKEIAAGKNIWDDLESSVFYRFYEKCQPTDMLHLVSRFDPHVTFAAPLGILPWGDLQKRLWNPGEAR